MKIYGILPMAGKGSRLQPIGFSKELYPVIVKGKHFAISEFSVNSMIKAGAVEIKLIINPNKMDIAKYYANHKEKISIYFYNSPSLPESCLFPIKGLHENDICMFGLPDTIFSPANAYSMLIDHMKQSKLDICLGLFKVKNPTKYDSVKLSKNNRVIGVAVKQNPAIGDHIWGIWAANVKTLKIINQYVNKQVNSKGERLLGVAFNKLSQLKNIKFGSIKLSNNYFDIGTMESALHINQIIRNLKI